MSDELKQSTFNSSLITHHSSLKNGDALDLDLRAVVEQGFNFDQNHRGVVAAHQRAPALAYLGGAREGLAPVRHVDDEAGPSPRSPAPPPHPLQPRSGSPGQLPAGIRPHEPLPLPPHERAPRPRQ